MNIDEFERDLAAKLAAMTDSQLREKLEALGAVFGEPWLDSQFDDSSYFCISGSESIGFDPTDSSELALAA